MKGIPTMRIVSITLLFAALLAADAPTLQAQSSFILSKNEDFSTDDRVFTRSDVLYARVTAAQIDFNDLEKNEFRLKPDDGGNDIRGVFTNHFDGAYTATVPLDITDPNESDWEWRARIRDDDGTEFEVRVDLQIGDDNEGEDEEDDDEDEEDEVEFTGTVEALDAGSITVDGTTFLVTDETVILDDDNTAITFDDLAVGMTVEIRGEHDADGVLVATDIKVEDDDEDEEDEVEFTGTVEALGAGSITIDGITFLVTDETVILDDDNTPITFDDLAVGMIVEIRGERDADGVLVATDIKIEDDDDEEDEVEFTGTVEALGAGSITVNGITFVVTEETIILDDDNNAITFDDLVVGMTVEIRGEHDADGVLVATDIKIEDDDDDEVEFTGTIGALDDGSITVGGIMFVVTDETVILDDDNNAITFDDLAVGMVVEIRGERDADGVLFATDIKIEDDEEDEVEFTGTIGALGDGSIIVGGITFVVTEETIILDDDNNPITLDDLAVGMTVEIRGERDADGVLAATDIKIEDPPAAAGRIETMEDDRLTVEAHTFLIDDDTRVLDAHAAPISLSDLEVGQTVEVHARTVAAAAMPVAAQVKVMGGGDVAAALEETEGDVPVRFVLGQNYPNPFNPETTISFELVKGARERVSLVIYNILGEAVRTLVQGELGPGRYQYAWDARNQRGHLVASGLYLYRLRVGDQVQTRRMVLLK